MILNDITPPLDEAFNVLGRSKGVLIEGGGFIGLKMKPGDKQINRLCKKLIGMGLEVLHATTFGKNEYYIVIRKLGT